jgi:hypothetical protein
LNVPAGAGKYILICLSIVVSAAVAGGFWVLGGPSQERERRMDDKRIEQLAAIGRAVDVYWSQHGKLPTGLSEVEREGGTTRDPDTMQPYEYKQLSPEKYELCATFQQSRARRENWGDFWNHGAGRSCFVLEARKVDH